MAPFLDWLDGLQTNGSAYREKHRVEYNEYQRLYYHRKPSYKANVLRNQKEKRSNRTPEELAEEREYKRCYMQRRMGTDPLFRLKHSLRRRTYMALQTYKNGKEKRQHTSELLGADWSVIKSWIEKQFEEGMSWENLGKWHITSFHFRLRRTMKNYSD